MRIKINSMFPYRKFYLDFSNSDLIFDTRRNVNETQWAVPKKSLFTQIDNFESKYFTTPIKVPTTNWYKDIVSDIFTEEARVSSIGYAETKSPLEFWREISKNGRIDAVRDEIYNSITEPRPAYVTTQLQVLKYFKDIQYTWMATDSPKFSQYEPCKMIDIAAYGERAIAASNLGIHYMGVDPNSHLVEGLSDLKQRLNNCDFYHLPLEMVITKRNHYNVFLMSPPPFNMEKYKGGHQTHEIYKDSISWFNGFIRESLIRASESLMTNGLFAFTALDRLNPEGPNIRYVENMLLFAESLGLMYQGAIGLNSNTPWWFFKKTSSVTMGNMTRTHVISDLTKFYPKTLLQQKFVQENEIVGIAKYKTFNYENSSIGLEWVRYQVGKHLINEVNKYFTSKNKIDVIIGRYLMTIVSELDEFALDTMYPYTTTATALNVLTQELSSKTKFLKEKVTAEDIMYKIPINFRTASVFFTETAHGLVDAISVIARYLNLVKSSNHMHQISRINWSAATNKITCKKHETNFMNAVIIGDSSRFAYQNSNFILLTVKPFDNVTYKNILSFLRYLTFNLIGHQYTRPMERSQIISDAFKLPVFDAFASVFNSRSYKMNKYCSLYPDIEENSIGSFYNITELKNCVVLVNPPSTSILDSLAVDKILSMKGTFVCGFTVWLDTNPDFVKKFKAKQIHEISDNSALNRALNSLDCIGAYILNTNVFKSVNPFDKSVVASRDTLSVGVVVSTEYKSIDLSELGEFISIRN